MCVIYAKEIVRSRKAVSRVCASKAQINSVILGINHQLASLRVAGSIQKSTEVMKSMQALVKVPEVAQTMQELSREMMKAGIIEEVWNHLNTLTERSLMELLVCSLTKVHVRDNESEMVSDRHNSEVFSADDGGYYGRNSRQRGARGRSPRGN